MIIFGFFYYQNECTDMEQMMLKYRESSLSNQEKYLKSDDRSEKGLIVVFIIKSITSKQRHNRIKRYVWLIDCSADL